MISAAVKDAATRAQRVDGTGRVAVACGDGGRSRLVELYQEGAARIRLPRTGRAVPEAVLINTAGGLTGGDRLAWHATAGPGASLVATTQACEKIYRASAGEARVACRLAVGDGARLSWLPQETILFDRSGLARRIEADVEGDGELTIVEACIFGRTAMGESVDRAVFSDRWHVRHEGRLVHAEAFAIGPAVTATLARAAVAGGGIATATILLVARDAQDRLRALRPLLGPTDGASAWSVGGTGKLLARVVARDGRALRQRLPPMIEVLNAWAGVPKAWAG